jgi:hypothetical protein
LPMTSAEADTAIRKQLIKSIITNTFFTDTSIFKLIRSFEEKQLSVLYL